MAGEMSIYSSGICAASVCVPKDATIQEIEDFVNKEMPTASKWKISEDKTFKGGEPMPCKCSQDPGKLHYLLNC